MYNFKFIYEEKSCIYHLKLLYFKGILHIDGMILLDLHALKYFVASTVFKNYIGNITNQKLKSNFKFTYTTIIILTNK